MTHPDDEAAEQVAELQAQLNAEMAEIIEAATMMRKHLYSLSDLGQKHAIAQVTAQWILSVIRDDRERAMMMSKHMVEQTEIYIQIMMVDDRKGRASRRKGDV